MAVVVLAVLLVLGGAVWWHAQAGAVVVQTAVARDARSGGADRTVLNASGYVTARRDVLLGRLAFSRSDVEQRAGHHPHHAVQKAVGAKVQPEQFALVLEPQRAKRAHRPAPLRQHAAERHEIVVPTSARAASLIRSTSSARYS